MPANTLWGTGAGIQESLVILDVPPSAGLMPASLYLVKPGMTKMGVL